MGKVTGFTCEANQQWEPKQHTLCHRKILIEKH